MEQPGGKFELNRREFLKRTGVAVAGVALSGFSEKTDAVSNETEEKQLLEDIKRIKHWFLDNYNLAIVPNTFSEQIHSADSVIRGEPMSLMEQRTMLISLQSEIIQYPKIFLKNSGLGTIYFAKKFFYKNKRRSGLAINNIIYLAPKQGLRGFSWRLDPGEFKKWFHHELFHIAEKLDDEKWAQLNPKGKEVYTGRDPGDDELFSRPNGFAGNYGKVSPTEDQATIASLLMRDPKTAFSIAENDLIFKAKLDFCKKEFARLSEGKMDEFFWQDLMAGKVNENYWVNKK